MRTGPVPPFASSVKAAQRKELWTQALVASSKDRERLFQAGPSGLKFHFRSQHLMSFFFLIYVSPGKSEEKLVEHLSSLCLEGRKYAPSLLGKHCKHWGFHNPNTSWFSKPSAWRPKELLRGEHRGAATWGEEVCFGNRAWNL